MIDLALYEDWLDGINTHIATQQGSAANIPLIIVINAVRSVMREFLVESKCWTHHSSVLNKTENTRQMLLPKNTFICKVWPIRRWPCFSSRLSYSHPNVIKIKDLTDSESNSEALSNIDVSLSVTQDSVGCPKFIYDRYYDGILSGVLANLQAMPGKAWTDPNMVAYHRSIFEDAVTRASSDIDSSFNRERSNYDIRPQYM